MRPFSYLRASDEGAAVATVAENPSASFVAGGTEMLNWMKDGIEEPGLLVDVNALPFKDVEASEEYVADDSYAGCYESDGRISVQST